jgi:hypothetical protein
MNDEHFSFLEDTGSQVMKKVPSTRDALTKND